MAWVATRQQIAFATYMFSSKNLTVFRWAGFSGLRGIGKPFYLNRVAKAVQAFGRAFELFLVDGATDPRARRHACRNPSLKPFLAMTPLFAV
jgi:hypothetical protein